MGIHSFSFWNIVKIIILLILLTNIIKCRERPMFVPVVYIYLTAGSRAHFLFGKKKCWAWSFWNSKTKMVLNSSFSEGSFNFLNIYFEAHTVNVYCSIGFEVEFFLLDYFKCFVNGNHHRQNFTEYKSAFWPNRSCMFMFSWHKRANDTFIVT